MMMKFLKGTMYGLKTRERIQHNKFKMAIPNMACSQNSFWPSETATPWRTPTIAAKRAEMKMK